MDAPPPSVEAAAVVLAAGGGRRFGGAKQLALLDGRPLVVHAVDAALAAGCDPVVVVVGAAGDAVRAAVGSRRQVRVVENPAWETGQATSLRAGLDALVASPGAAAPGVAVVLLADQPGVGPDAVRAVAAAVAAGASVARARYADGPSHPVALAREVWARVAALSGDTGARALFADLDVVLVPVPGAVPPDVDRPEDLARIADAGEPDARGGGAGG